MRKLLLLGAAIALIVWIFGQSLVTSKDEPLTPRAAEDSPAAVDLPGAGEGAVDGDPELYEEVPDADEVQPVRSRPISRGGKDEEFAYQEAVDSFTDHYRETINEINPLIHILVMQSQGARQMTEAEAEVLDARLSDMEDASEFGAVESYPEGYEDCSRLLGVGAVALDVAARSIRGFEETSNTEYLEDYQALVGMYLQAVSEAESCVSDHLYPAYP